MKVAVIGGGGDEGGGVVETLSKDADVEKVIAAIEVRKGLRGLPRG